MRCATIFSGTCRTYLKAGDLLVFNNTRVIKARLHGAKESGGKIEVLVERVLDEHHVLAHIRASHSPQPGSALLLEGCLTVRVMEREGALYRLQFAGDEPVLDLLERHGSLPLPPYITHAPDAVDETRYQTVYASEPGAVAAPTAGLHFDEAMLAELEAMGVRIAYVTLHVGAGTFQPVRVDNIADHKMHSECYQVPQETVDAILRAKKRRRTRHGSGHHLDARAGIRGSGWGTESRLRRNQHFHHAGLPVPRGGAPAHQFSPAQIHPADAGVCLRRHG